MNDKPTVNHGNKRAYSKSAEIAGKTSSALMLGLVSIASVLAGGLATAWWYRKTLTKLQNPILSSPNLPEREEDEDGESVFPQELNR